jgi:hypothetical protein
LAIGRRLATRPTSDERLLGEDAILGSAGLDREREELMTYTGIYEKGPTSWGAYVPVLPGVITVGDTRAMPAVYGPA